MADQLVSKSRQKRRNSLRSMGYVWAVFGALFFAIFIFAAMQSDKWLLFTGETIRRPWFYLFGSLVFACQTIAGIVFVRSSNQTLDRVINWLESQWPYSKLPRG
ncbi:MAG: hypothetical protein V4650_05820 [Pseudomonadota bacterium]